MHLTRFTDYALRSLLFVAARPGELVPIATMSRAYGISHNHLVKVVRRLVELGYLDTQRGARGGVCLARPPETINVGQVVRDCEPHLELLECFSESSTCPLTNECALQDVLAEARDAFMAIVDRHTIADMVRKSPAVSSLVNITLAPS